MTEMEGIGPPSDSVVTPLVHDEGTAPRNVIAALARVMAGLGGIGKLTAKQRRDRGIDGGDTGILYAYRGIDQIAGAAQPLMGRHGVITVPTVEQTRVDPIVVNGKPWTDTWVRVHWTIYGPAGPDDRIDAVTEGQGRDNSDKGINKAMTGAYKNLLLRLFCIGDPADDTDGHTTEADAPLLLPQATLDKFEAAASELSADEKAEVVAAATGGRTTDPAQVWASELDGLRAALDGQTPENRRRIATAWAQAHKTPAQ